MKHNCVGRYENISILLTWKDTDTVCVLVMKNIHVP